MGTIEIIMQGIATDWLRTCMVLGTAAIVVSAALYALYRGFMFFFKMAQ